MRKQLFLTLTAVIVLAGCGRGNEAEGEVVPTATPVPQESQRITVRLAADRSVPSMIDRWLEVQVVEVVNGSISPDAPVAASVTQGEIGHTQGLPSEWSVNLTVAGERGKEYGLRGGVFDDSSRGVMLLNGECQGQENCRFFQGGAAQVYRVNMIPAVDGETFYAKAVPEQVRSRCQLVPDSQTCGVTRTMQYYDGARDTCFPASWGSCGEVTPFKNAGECIQACRRQWP